MTSRTQISNAEQADPARAAQAQRQQARNLRSSSKEAVRNQWKRFGQWLDQKLAEGSINQSELSRRTGIAREHLRRIRLGQTGTKHETVIAIADALGVPHREALRAAQFEREIDADESMGERAKVLLDCYRDLPEDIQGVIAVMVEAVWRRYKRNATSDQEED